MRVALILSALALSTSILAAPSEPELHLFGRQVAIQCTDATKRSIITAEIKAVREMADFASQHFTESDYSKYYNAFFPQALRDDKDFPDKLKTTFSNMNKIWDINTGDYVLRVTCINTTPECADVAIAHMSDNLKRMNLCDSFFDDKKSRATADAIADCKSTNPSCRTLEDFAETRSVTLAHEVTHTNWVTQPRTKALDFAYYVKDCIALASGTFDRSKSRYKKQSFALCPDENGNEGKCDPARALDNADSLALLAAGVYYRSQCGTDIPLRPGTAEGLIGNSQCVAQTNVQTDVPPEENGGEPYQDPYRSTEQAPPTEEQAPPPEEQAPPPPPPPPPCKSGRYSNSAACSDACGDGECICGSAGFPQPIRYCDCRCP